MITTSVARVKAAGYWCGDADSETGRVMQKLGATENTEVNIKDVLDIIGLGAALMFLGVPHPRYADKAGGVVMAYALALLTAIECDFNVELPAEMSTIIKPERDGLRRECNKEWKKKKLNAVTASDILMCEAVLILLSAHPLHIRAVHAGRKYFTATHRKNALELMKDLLQRMLE